MRPLNPLLKLLIVAATFAPVVAAAEIRITLVGDSTQTEKQGYGTGFCANLVDVDCVNQAKGGASTKTYRNDGLWDRALASKPDWMLIQFGHNDVQSSAHTSRETDLATEYPANLHRYIQEAREAGIKPILLTPIARRYYGANGKIKDDLDGHVAAMKKVAEEERVPLLDLHTLSLAKMEQLGEVEGHKLGPTKKDAEGRTVPDKTHFNRAGSFVFGRIVAEALAQLLPELKPHLASQAAQP